MEDKQSGHRISAEVGPIRTRLNLESTRSPVAPKTNEPFAVFAPTVDELCGRLATNQSDQRRIET
jgi:hypothetical protein